MDSTTSQILGHSDEITSTNANNAVSTVASPVLARNSGSSVKKKKDHRKLPSFSGRNSSKRGSSGSAGGPLLTFYSLSGETFDDLHGSELHDAESNMQTETTPMAATTVQQLPNSSSSANSTSKPAENPLTIKDNGSLLLSDSPPQKQRKMPFEFLNADLKSLRLFRPPAKEVDAVDPKSGSESGGNAHLHERNATWLELFFDIFFVVIIRIWSHSVHDTAMDWFFLVVKFTVLWWSWIVVTLYDTKYDTDDLYHRLGKLIQMIAISGFALSIQNNHKNVEMMDVFTISYIIIRFVLLVNFIMVYCFAFKRSSVEKNRKNFYEPDSFHDLESSAKMPNFDIAPVPSLSNTRQSTSSKSRTKQAHQILRTKTRIMQNVIAIGFFGFSMLSSVPVVRISIWMSSFLVDFLLQIWITRHTHHAPFSGSHLPERMGLFTITVLGECIVGVLEQASAWVVALDPNTLINYVQSPLNVESPFSEMVILVSLFIIITYCFWWMYFDDFSSNIYQFQRPSHSVHLYDRIRNLWIYLHLPVHILFAICGILMVDIINSAAAFRIVYKFQAGKLVFKNATDAVINIAGIATSLSPEGKVHGDTHHMDESGDKQTIDIYSRDRIQQHHGTVSQSFILVFGLIFTLSAITKYLNTYKNEDAKYDYITCACRLLIAIILFSMMAIPNDLFQKRLESDTLLPMTYLVLAMAIITIVQVGVDVYVQALNSKQLRRTITRSRSVHIYEKSKKPPPASTPGTRHAVSGPMNPVPLHART